MQTIDLDRIYTEYSGKVMGYIRARIRSSAEAEDLHSEVFEKILKKIEEFDPSKASLNTWIFTITRNTVIDHFRRSKPSEELDENLSDNVELDEDLLNSETHHRAALLRRQAADRNRRDDEPELRSREAPAPERRSDAPPGADRLNKKTPAVSMKLPAFSYAPAAFSLPIRMQTLFRFSA